MYFCERVTTTDARAHNLCAESISRVDWLILSFVCKDTVRKVYFRLDLAIELKQLQHGSTLESAAKSAKLRIHDWSGLGFGIAVTLPLG